MEREILTFCPHPLTLPSRGRGKHESEAIMLGWGDYIASITLSMTDKQLPIAYTLLLTTQSHIQIRNTQRIGLDKFAAWFDNITHELREDVIRINRFAHFHLQERTHITIKRCFP